MRGGVSAGPGLGLRRPAAPCTRFQPAWRALQGGVTGSYIMIHKDTYES